MQIPYDYDQGNFDSAYLENCDKCPEKGIKVFTLAFLNVSAKRVVLYFAELASKKIHAKNAKRITRIEKKK